ncbi:hypothetical protein OG873_31480 [Streptomyces violaceus]|uniref:hypothetical protein n=1 Tax=Streptomyces violaceus TaxID=1936 RepID=UPI002E2A272C|nr:hypothetical protein [Streptomyces violaceus]
MNMEQGPGKGPITSNDITVTEIGGQRVLVVQPVVPDDAPAPLKNASAIRRATNNTGVCPDYGARRVLPNRAARRAAAKAGRLPTARTVHKDDCEVLCGGDGGAL